MISKIMTSINLQKKPSGRIMLTVKSTSYQKEFTTCKLFNDVTGYKTYNDTKCISSGINLEIYFINLNDNIEEAKIISLSKEEVDEFESMIAEFLV